MDDAIAAGVSPRHPALVVDSLEEVGLKPGNRSEAQGTIRVAEETMSHSDAIGVDAVHFSVGINVRSRLLVAPGMTMKVVLPFSLMNAWSGWVLLFVLPTKTPASLRPRSRVETELSASIE